jgi:conjugal transfer/type IV secretion protein DotA/TraY
MKKQSIFMKIMMAVLMIGLPAIAFSQVPNGQFTTPPDDYFINYMLGGLLGNNIVDPNGATAQATITGNGTMGEIFRQFNLGVAFFGSLMVLFLTIVGVMQTGHDGEFLGRKWSSMWVPVRFAFGSALMLPLTNSGYNFIQALILWIATQGVGFADSVWNTAVDTLAVKNGTQISAQIPSRDVMENVAKSMACVNVFNRIRADQGGTPQTDGLNSNAFPRVNGYVISFGSQGLEGYDVICGKIEMPYPTTVYPDPLNSVKVAIIQQHRTQIVQASNNAALQGAVSNFVDAVREDTGVQAARDNLSNVIDGLSRQYALAMTQSVDAAMASSPFASADRMAATMKQFGFATAGMYYIELARVANAAREGLNRHPEYTSPNMELLLSYASSPNADLLIKSAMTAISTGNRAYVNNSTPATSTGQGSQVRIRETSKSIFSDLEKGNFSNFSANVGMWLIDATFGVGARNTGATQTWNPLANGANQSSAIMQLKDKGDYILDINGTLMIGAFLASKTVEGAATSPSMLNLIPGIGEGKGAAAGFIRGATPILLGLIVAMMAFGLSLAIFLPMMPYMLWVAGIAGLLVLIIEALVASVIWTVMIMHPSGEGITSDHSRGGLMILLTLFMRPTLMLMGMIGGIMLIEVLILFVNDTFSYAMNSLQAGSVTGLFSWFGFGAVYVTILITLMSKCFSLIHVVPDRVLRWIGGGGENLGESGYGDRFESSTKGGAAVFASRVQTGGKGSPYSTKVDANQDGIPDKSQGLGGGGGGGGKGGGKPAMPTSQNVDLSGGKS